MSSFAWDSMHCVCEIACTEIAALWVVLCEIACTDPGYSLLMSNIILSMLVLFISMKVYACTVYQYLFQCSYTSFNVSFQWGDQSTCIHSIASVALPILLCHIIVYCLVPNACVRNEDLVYTIMYTWNFNDTCCLCYFCAIHCSMSKASSISRASGNPWLETT